MRLGRQMMRRIVAGLVALALLVAPAMPLRHAAAALPASPHAAHHCATDEVAPAVHAAHADHVGHAAPALVSDAVPEKDQPTRDTGGMACCAAAQCPATIAVPPTAAAPVPPPAPPAVTGFPAVHQLDGIPVDPALRPPRRVA